MALIAYPATDWNTFGDLATIDANINAMVVSANVTAYLALTLAEKEAILIQTARQIRLCGKITLPETLEDDLVLAQSYLAVYAVGLDMLEYDPNNKAVTYEKVGDIATAYANGQKGSNTDFDPMTSSLLKQYGCRGRSSGFSQSTVTRV